MFVCVTGAHQFIHVYELPTFTCVASIPTPTENLRCSLFPFNFDSRSSSESPLLDDPSYGPPFSMTDFVAVSQRHQPFGVSIYPLLQVESVVGIDKEDLHVQPVSLSHKHGSSVSGLDVISGIGLDMPSLVVSADQTGLAQVQSKSGKTRLRLLHSPYRCCVVRTTSPSSEFEEVVGKAENRGSGGISGHVFLGGSVSERGPLRHYDLSRPDASSPLSWPPSPSRSRFASHTQPVWALLPNLRHGYLLSGGSDRKVLMWDLRRPKSRVRSISVGDGVFGLSYDSRSASLVVATTEIEVFDLRRTETRLRVIRPHQEMQELLTVTGHAIYDLVRVGNGTFVSVCWDGSVVGWRLDGKIIGWAKEKTGGRNYGVVTYGEMRRGFGGIVSFGEESPILEREQLEKIEFLVGLEVEESSSIVLHIRCGDMIGDVETTDLRCPKSLICNSTIPELKTRTEFCVDLPDSAAHLFDSETFVGLLFGRSPFVSVARLSAYFRLFVKIGLREHAFLICRHLSSESSLSEILSFLCGIPRDEQVEDSFSWKGLIDSSAFVRACVDALKWRTTTLSEDKTISSLMLWDLVRSRDLAPLESHTLFSGLATEALPVSFSELFLRTRDALFRSRAFPNLSLRAHDGANEKVHVELLVWSSSFFQQMVRFGGLESGQLRSGGVVLMEDFSSDGLAALVEFLYTGSLGDAAEMNLQVLLELLVHVSMHSDLDLRSCVRQAISKRVQKMSPAEAHAALLENSSRLLEVPDDVRTWLQGKFRKSMESEISYSDLLGTIVELSAMLGQD